MAFNPNELIIEKVRAVEEYSTATNELIGRYTQIEDPSLSTSADGTDVTDAMGTPIATFYNNQQATFGFTNSLFSLDLAASQYGTEKKLASSLAKIQIPVSETLKIETDNTVTLSYTPVGTEGSEVGFVKVINDNNTFGETYTVSTEANAGSKTFKVEASSKKITLPEGVTGKVFVNYVRESENAAAVSKTTEDTPKVVKLLIHVIFHDPCDINKKYAGTIVAERAQLTPASVELSLKMDGKHSAEYMIKSSYCSDDSKLFEILVAED